MSLEIQSTDYTIMTFSYFLLHMLNFNPYKFLTLHSLCVGPRGRKRELITISDDSDEEPVTLVPGSPVLIPDDADDDDIRILEVTARQTLLRRSHA